jgi:hypothetical protein
MNILGGWSVLRYRPRPKHRKRYEIPPHGISIYQGPRPELPSADLAGGQEVVDALPADTERRGGRRGRQGDDDKIKQAAAPIKELEDKYRELEGQFKELKTETAKISEKEAKLLAKAKKDYPQQFDAICKAAGFKEGKEATRVYDLLRIAKGGRQEKLHPDGESLPR